MALKYDCNISGKKIQTISQAGMTLKGSAKLNKLLLDSLPHPVMLINRKHIVLAANKIAMNAGVKIGKYCWDTFRQCVCISENHKQRIKNDPGCFKEDISCTFCLANKLIKTGSMQNNPEVHAFGKIWDTWWVPVEDDIFLHYAIDVTDQKLAEKALQKSRTVLQESNRKFLTIMDSLEAIVYITDIKTYDLLYVNQYGINKFGNPSNKKCWEYIQKNQKSPCPFCEAGCFVEKRYRENHIIAWEHQNTIDGKWYQNRDICINWIDNRPVLLHISMDITKNKHLAMQLEKRVKEKTLILTDEINKKKQIAEKLTEKSRYLEQANRALKAMLDNRDAEKRAIEQHIFLHLKKFVLPYFKEIKRQQSKEKILILIDIINAAIDQLMLPSSHTLFSRYIDFTPMEIKVADLVKQGMQTKEISEFLNIAKSSVSTHRNNIRKKLGLCNQKINLRVYLNALSS